MYIKHEIKFISLIYNISFEILINKDPLYHGDLYILSNEPVVKGDWYYSVIDATKVISKCDTLVMEEILNEYNFGIKKIVATTNKEINEIPKIPGYLIELFLKDYKHLKEVLVKYNPDGSLFVDNDNYIKAVYEKQLYTRNEVINILKKLNINEDEISNLL